MKKDAEKKSGARKIPRVTSKKTGRAATPKGSSMVPLSFLSFFARQIIRSLAVLLPLILIVGDQDGGSKRILIFAVVLSFGLSYFWIRFLLKRDPKIGNTHWGLFFLAVPDLLLLSVPIFIFSTQEIIGLVSKKWTLVIGAILMTALANFYVWKRFKK